MASYSVISKVSVRKTVEQTNSPAVENKEINNELIEQVKELFQELFSNITNSSRIHSISTIFLKLNDICHNLITENNYSISFAFDIFNMILKNYIKLLDIDQFVDGIQHHDSKENNNLLRKFFDIKRHYDLQKLIEQMTIKTRREIFFSLLDELNSSTRLILYLQNNMSNDNDIDQILINSCSFILYVILKILNDLRVKVTDNDLEKYQNTILTLFITFINEYFIKKKHLRVNEKYHGTLIKEILHFICNITDKTLTIPIFININCPQTCLQWLSLSYLNGYEYKCIIGILNNIARHDEGVIVLSKSDCVKIVRQFKNEVLNINIDFIINKDMRSAVSLLLDLILALVVDPDELHAEEINSGTINQVLSTTKIILKSTGFRYEGCHISELFIALMKLCTNDNIIDYILQQNQYQTIFLATLKTFLSDIENEKLNDDNFDMNVLTIMALANIIWSISFHDRYKNELIQNINTLKKLEVFRETDTINYVLPRIYIPHQMLSLRRTIDGIWQNLFPSLPTKLENKSISNRKIICSLMISYSHVNIDFCRQLYDVLSTIPQLSINVDINTGKYLWKEISQTIEQSDVVLFLLSKDFFYNKSCRQELIYVTDILKKLFLPIFIDHDFKPTGWLHKRIARLKCIRFGEINFMNTCEELLSMINEHLYMNISLVRNSLDIKQWNDQEVKQWFTKNHILPELYEFYQFRNGNELLLYGQAILAFPWINEYERIKLRFEEKFQQQKQNLSQDQFLQLINALERLQKQTYFN
ncbi:unnamed protein product [Rotaria sordida]|uniref:TIR domain-containing protein n=2 Tax=Rotaria sordida TaxID=392033 RepID=A0A814JY09_9BILA|nr:unnamed protein product [Rotaria sordida]